MVLRSTYCTRARFALSHTRRGSPGVCAAGRQWLRWQSTQTRPAVQETVIPPSLATERTPLQLYDERCRQGKLRRDNHQRSIIEATITRLHNELRTHKFPEIEPPKIERPTKSGVALVGVEKVWAERHEVDAKEKTGGFFARLFGRGTPAVEEPQKPEAARVKGMYLHGDVGCGKTMLMDLFFETLPSQVKHKQRIHFHAFMLSVHKKAHQLKAEHGNSFDAIPYIAADIGVRSQVLCFDEFQVTDIVDAMILRQLLQRLIDYGVVVFTTSNRKPDDLYRGGIQRVSFLPCIALLEKELDVVCLDSPTDYRKLDTSLSDVYHTGLGPEADRHADAWFERLGDFANDGPRESHQEIWGRQIRVPLASGSCAKFTFDEICGQPLSASDYLTLAQSYRSFVITDIPQLTLSEKDKARRLITLIDSLYESGTRLVCTSAVPMREVFSSEAERDIRDLDSSMRAIMDDLGLDMTTFKDSNIFTGDEERFAFHRCLSRLAQMGTHAWVSKP
ncbi:ATPase [Savitreella phatthalungensis]